MPETVSKVINDPKMNEKLLLEFRAFIGFQNRLVNDKFVPFLLQQFDNVIFQYTVDSEFVKVRVDSKLEEFFLFLQLFENSIGLRLLFVL